MSDENETSTDKEAKRPTHGAFQVNESRDGKSYFNRIGAAFEHRDKEGYNVQLDAVPVDGKITLRTLKERVQQTRDGKEAESARDDRETER